MKQQSFQVSLLFLQVVKNVNEIVLLAYHLVRVITFPGTIYKFFSRLKILLKIRIDVCSVENV